ncbi:MAG: NUDIX hydrolase [Clostridia bacterium]|nr:NUDIX hydrolase [Clostridia bacterium]
MSELRDRNGLTESEFLKAYDASKYERPSVTVDIIVINDGRMMLIRRGGHPFLGKLALPGGFVEPDEDVYHAAARELREETGLKAKSLSMLPVFSDPKRDPRTRIITVPFLAEVEGDPSAQASDDAADAKWFGYDYSCRPVDGGEEICVALSNGAEKVFFKVSKTVDKSGSRADPVYGIAGENPLAGDHAAIIALALDVFTNRR